MERYFFCISLVVIIIIFLFVIRKNHLKLKDFNIWLLSIAYSLVYESFFGSYLHLYHYINIHDSLLYIIVSGVIIYPLLNIIYIRFLPAHNRILYTVVWIIGMQVFELVTIAFKTLVLTGWHIVPYSIITYVVTYLILLKYNEFFERSTKSVA